MQSRWTLLTSHGRVVSRRQLQQRQVALLSPRHFPSGRNLKFADRSRSFRSNAMHHSSWPLRSAFTASFSTMEDIEDEEIDEDVESFAASCLSHLLRDDLRSQFQDVNSSSNDGLWEACLTQPSRTSLDYELGEASIWDTAKEEELEDSDSFQGEDYSESVKPINPPPQRQAKTPSARDLLLNFDPLNPPPSDNLEAMQLWLECESQRESVLKFQASTSSARERKDYGSLNVVQKHVLEWYKPLQEAIESKQRSYVLKSKMSKDLNKYGPYLCTLQPQKLAVIVAHETLMHMLLGGGDGATLSSTAMRLGDAVEAEVNVQRLLLARLETSRSESDITDAVDQVAPEPSSVDETSSDSEDNENIQTLLNSWMYGASHLQRFVEEANKFDPGRKTRMRISYANRRARKLLSSAEEWTKGEKVKLGAALLQILLENATIDVKGLREPAFTYENRFTGNKKRIGRIILHDKLFRMTMEDSTDALMAYTTRHKPMIIPPRDWVAPDAGGYCWLRTEFMRTHGSNAQKEAIRAADLSIVFDGLNVLGRVPWVINDVVLDVAQRCWTEYIALGDIPLRTDYDVPPMPIAPDGYHQGMDKASDTYRAWLAEYRTYKEALAKHRRAHQKNMDLRSLRSSAMLKLEQGKKFKNFEAIYFPYNLDFRGRAYPVPPHLSNVGSDLCRGMLKFSKAKPLGKRGLYWLKVHLANLAGNDKLTFEGRAEYSERNMDNIRDAVADPFGENRWWMTLEDPFQGLATCHEIINAIDSGDPESYMCSLPVHMDGSCNGLQHYAALGRDVVGGKAVNLCSVDKPQDVYVGVMHEVIRRVAAEAAITLEYENADPDELSKPEKEALKKNRAAKLVNGLIDRGVVKRTVMTSVYGVTYVGARKQIQEKIEEKLVGKGLDIDEIEYEVHSACGYLANVTIGAMGELFSGARQTMNWLASCARLIAQQGQPVAWISPIGVPVVQPYRETKPYTIVTLLQSIVLVESSDDLPIHKQRQVTAFPPNYVHSLDSSHMLLTALEMDRRGLTFSAVHDSFWTHACDIDEMNEALRNTFVDLYEQPLLERLRETWELRYPSITFPDLPDRGELDLNAVKSATYFFQ